MSVSTYKFGGLNVTKQAFIVLLGGTTLAILLFCAGLYMAFMVPSRIAAGTLMMLSLIVFAITCYQAYIVNCTIVGKCNKLAWFLCLGFMIALSSYAITGAMMIKRKTSPSARTKPSPKSKK